jgi:hypothetical protein
MTRSQLLALTCLLLLATLLTLLAVAGPFWLEFPITVILFAGAVKLNRFNHIHQQS